jgi:hypothetical protein
MAQKIGDSLLKQKSGIKLEPDEGVPCSDKIVELGLQK